VSEPETCVIVPFYNEEIRINSKLDYWKDLFQIPNIHWHLMNDGSTDKTLELLEHMEVSSSAVTVKNLSKNIGKAKTVQKGLVETFSECSSSTIGFIDGDGAISKKDIEHAVLLIQEDMGKTLESVWGSRVSLSGRSIHRTTTRQWFSRLVATLFATQYKNLPYDTQCGLKMFQRNTKLYEALQSEIKTRWFFDLEILMYLQEQSENTYRIWEHPLSAWEDVANSKLMSLKNLFGLTAEISYIWWSLRRLKHRRPSANFSDSHRNP
jgi:glycosyltransferase involved in cell wall biosynthesis